MYLTSAFKRGAALSISAAFATMVFAQTAAADVTLVDKDGWSVFMNGRVQTFFNYNKGDGRPVSPLDANGNSVSLQGGGLTTGREVDPEIKEGADPTLDPGKVEEFRIRTGFVGNVLGFGIKNQITETTDVTAYSAVTVYIDSSERRKYLESRPDWRESYMKISAPWGSVSAGRTLVLFSRGATEITYLYGFKYGLGWPGSISSKSGNGPGAGHVGFGVLANGFGAGVAYATPVLAGAQLSVGLYDANSLVGSMWERGKWPRPEAELTYEMSLGDIGMFKLFGNGAYQKIYEIRGYRDATIWGVGYGGRVEVGPVKLGVAGHMGEGIGVDFALQPADAGWHLNALPGVDQRFRPVDGYYGQLMVSPHQRFDVMAGGGITRVLRIAEDKVDTYDNDGDDPNNNGLSDPDNDGVEDVAATSVFDDDGTPGPDPVNHAPLQHQLGLSGGVTFHLSDSLHLTLEYFRAIFQWNKPMAPVPGSKNPTQKFHVVNAGITYDF